MGSTLEELYGFFGDRNTIREVYNTGNVSGNEVIGGIIGFANQIVDKSHNTKFIYNSYNTGKITAVQYGGGIWGIAQSGANTYNCVNTTDQITGKTIGSIWGWVYGSYYSYTNTRNCYYNGNLNVIGAGKGSVTDSIAFTDEVDKNIMLETLKTDLSPIEWKGNLVDIWKTTTANHGYPVLYWE